MGLKQPATKIWEIPEPIPVTIPSAPNEEVAPNVEPVEVPDEEPVEVPA